MLDFLKKLGMALYDCTIGGAVRLYRNTKASKVDGQDKQYVGRVITYVAYALFALVLPELAVFVAMFRMLVVLDVIGTIASIFQHTANAYAEV